MMPLMLLILFFTRSSADPKEKHRDGGGQSRGGDGGYNQRGGRDQRGRSISPNPYHDSNNRNGGGNNNGGGGGPVNPMNNPQQNAPQGNMPAGMGAFNMSAFPMNPAMFAALASQGMFGMPNMMGPNGPMGGFPNQQQQGFNGGAPNGGANFNYGGYGAQGGYGQQGGFGQQQQQQGQGPSGNNSSQNNYGGSPGNMWGSSSGSGDSKDLKGTAGWSQNSRQEPMNSSSGWGS